MSTDFPRSDHTNATDPTHLLHTCKMTRNIAQSIRFCLKTPVSATFLSNMLGHTYYKVKCGALD